MGRTYYIRQRRTGCVWPVITFFVTLGLWAWCRLMAAGTRYAERREHETRS